MGVNGPLVVKWLPVGDRFNTTYFINEIINALVETLKERGEWKERKWYRLHLDNARPHNSKDSERYIDRHFFHRLPHPPYSPDLAPSDFYLFGALKTSLTKCHGESREDLFENVRRLLAEINPDEFKSVFLTWMKRLQKVIDTNGEYC